MRFRGSLMKFIHPEEVRQSSRSKGKNIVYFEILLRRVPLGHTQVSLPIHHDRIDDLVVVPSIALDLSRRDRQRGQRKIAITHIYQPVTPIQVHDQCQMFEFPAIPVIPMMKPPGDQVDFETTKIKQVMEENI